MSRSMIPVAVLSLAIVACSDAPSPAAPSHLPDAKVARVEEESGARGLFKRYVAIGTSVSMGWAADGGFASAQLQSWPAQLSRAAGWEMSQPLLAGTGCRPPLQAPLASGIRINGQPAGVSAADVACGGLVSGAVALNQNVAVSSARASHALTWTPEVAQTAADAFYKRLYPLLLPAGHTQVSAMEAQDPRVVSVELGGNDVLDARSGIPYAPVVTPLADFTAAYTAILDRVQAPGRKVVLVGLVDDVRDFPAFRTGAEIWSNKALFLQAFHVDVQADCENSPNMLFVPVRVPTAVGTGVARRNASLTPATLSCAAGAPGQVDFVLDPTEVGIVNMTLAGMNQVVRQQAANRGFAHFELQALYGMGLKGPFNVVQFMTTGTPYGQYVSLDGIHPSAAGQSVLAAAAANALNQRYGMALAAPGY